jgi:hypothetical protein
MKGRVISFIFKLCLPFSFFPLAFQRNMYYNDHAHVTNCFIIFASFIAHSVDYVLMIAAYIEAGLGGRKNE